MAGYWDNLTFLYVSLRTIGKPVQCVECWPMPDRLCDANVRWSGQCRPFYSWGSIFVGFVRFSNLPLCAF